MDALAKTLIQRHDALKADRSNWEHQWQQIAEFVKPMQADFTVQRMPGERRGLEVFDATPGLALDNLAAGLWGMVTNSANTWFSLAHPDEAINEDHEARAWMDDVQQRMLNQFSANGQVFYSRALDLYSQLACFGTALMFVDEAEPGRLRFSVRALTECVIAEDEQERVDSVFRRFHLSARQAVQRWGDKAPKRARDMMDRTPDAKLCFLHAVYPNKEREPGRLDGRGKAFASVHVCVDSGELVQVGGFDEFPYMVPRWSTATRGVYGESPAQLALSDIKTLNVMSKTFLIASQKAADPPILAADENAMFPVRLTPGGITYGAVDAEGRPLLRTLDSTGNFALTDAMLEQKRMAVREAFYASLLMMVQRPNATATEVLARQEEQLRLMGPHLGRIQAEFLDPLIGRVFNVMWRGNLLPPLPPALARNPVVQAEYVSPLARAQKASEAQAVLRTVEAVVPIAQIRPDVVRNFDWDQVVRAIARGHGVPAKLLRDPRVVEEEAAAAQAQAAEQQQQAQMMEMAKVAPGVAKAAETMGMQA